MQQPPAVTNIADLTRIWADVPTCQAEIRCSRSTIFRIVNNPENGIRSFNLISQPGNQMGKKLINLADLRRFIARQAERARAGAHRPAMEEVIK